MFYEECFGEVELEFFKKQKYFKAIPNKMIKFYHYYLMEEINWIGVWFIGTEQKNDTIEFTHCSETLEDAFDSL